MPHSDVTRESLPTFLEPMLLSPGRPAPEGPGAWAVEVKFDGIRAQLRIDGTRGWCVRSRPGRDCTGQFPELAALAEALAPHRVILDGELVHFAADGRPDFGSLRRRLTAADGAAVARRPLYPPATLVIFDVLHLDDRAVRTLPYITRRALLTDLLPEGEPWRLAPAWTERLDDVIEVTRAHELEGVVFKRLDSTYRPGRRSTHWRKLKHRRRETLPVTAWTPSDDAPDTFFLARVDARGVPIPAGGVQLGLTRDDRDLLRAALIERELPRAGRRRVRAVAAGVHVVVDSHGRTDGPLRDAVIRSVHIDND